MPKVTPKDAENEAGPVIARPTLARHIAFWGLAGLGLVLFLYVFSSILLPFLAGMVLAYFLDPVADRLEKMGITIPVVPGIMPIVNFTNLVRFSDMCGAEIPRWIRKQLEAYGDDSESIRKFGEEVVTRMCEKLLAAGAPGLHFYTLNQAEASLAIWKNLGLDDQKKISF